MKLKTLEQFKEERTDLHKIWNNMSREELLEEIWKESLDAVNMEIRVGAFMEHCVNVMSNTNYTPESIEYLVKSKQEQDIADFCSMIYEDGKDSGDIVGYILDEVREKAIEGRWYEGE